MRLTFQEHEWALSSAWSGGDGDFFPPELTNVSNLGHPLFARIAVPHVVLNFDESPDKANFLVPIDSRHFHCARIDILSDVGPKVVDRRGAARGPGELPERLSAGFSRTIYGHTALNDLSLWGSHYIRLLYALRDADLLALLKGLGDPRHLWIEILFQFGPYSSEPAHEPSGMLTSARLIPAISFDTDSPYLKRLRFDVRCDPRLESLDMRVQDQGFPEIGLVSLDSEVLDLMAVPKRFHKKAGKSLSDAFSEGFSYPLSDAFSEDFSEALGAAAFEKIEKPLLYEICSTGWRSRRTPAPPSPAAPTPGPGTIPAGGSPPAESPTGEKPADPVPAGDPLWDNVHIAPGKRVQSGWVPALPSGPGAFYALHCHWRWGAMLSDFWYLDNNLGFRRALTALLPTKFPISAPLADQAMKEAYRQFMDRYFHTLHPDGRDAQYRGLPITAGMGGPLFDPNLGFQTVQFAIAKSSRAELGEAVKFGFVPHFAGAAKEPDPIDSGAELSWWLSFAVERPDAADPPAAEAAPFGGTLFAHGMHFAHNLYEPTQWLDGPDASLSALTAGRPAYVPDDVPRKWER